MKMALQTGDIAEQFFQPVEGHFANVAVLQRYGITLMLVAGNSVEAEQFTSHLKARDLFGTGGIGMHGFEMPDPNGVQILKLVAHAVQIIVFQYAATLLDNAIQTLQIIVVQPHGQT